MKTSNECESIYVELVSFWRLSYGIIYAQFIAYYVLCESVFYKKL